MQDSKVVWVGEQRVLTSGFSADRSRELTLRDTRQLAKPQHTLSLDVSSGILVPLYDPDTNMIFLSGECSFTARQGKHIPTMHFELGPVLRIRIRRIHMLFGLPDPDPDPLFRGTDPDSALELLPVLSVHFFV
jgi:hypothetical protein